MKNQAIVIRKYGGSSVLKLENIEIDEPGRNEILLLQIGIGVNYHDIYVRSGLYKTLDLPGIPGCEGVGIIEKKGSQVDHFEIGDKVVYIDKQYGSYSNYKLIPQELAIKVPKNIKSELVASNYLRAMTVIMLLEHVAVYVLLVFAIISTFILNRTTIGRYIFAIGGNEDASILSGIKVNLVKIFAFSFCGFASGIAAAVQVSRITLGTSQAGLGMELQAIAAVILGGTSIYGGSGAVWRSIAGVMLLALINNGFNILNADPFYKDLTTGLVIIAAVALTAGRK